MNFLLLFFDDDDDDEDPCRTIVLTEILYGDLETVFLPGCKNADFGVQAKKVKSSQAMVRPFNLFILTPADFFYSLYIHFFF